MNTNIVEVTPEIASQWLEANLQNRTINQKRVDQYAAEMLTGNWKQSHQGIAFYEDGGFADGQHRLLAIVRSGVKIRMPVTWGVPRESSIAIDSHQMRTTNQSIAISGAAPWIGKHEVSITKSLVRLYNQSITRVTPQMVVTIAEKNSDIIRFGANCFPTSKANITPAIVRTGLAVASRIEGEAIIQRMADILYSGMPDCHEDRAAIVLREYLFREGRSLNSGDSSRRVLAAKVMHCAKSFAERRPISRVTPSIKLPYTISISIK